MIEFPSGKASPPASASTTASTASPSTVSAAQASDAADLAAATAAENVDAVVLETKARQASGQLEKPAWDMLLKLNPAAGSVAGGPQTSLSPEQLRALQAGQALLVRTTASFPLPPDTRLQVNANLEHGLQIQRILPPPTQVPLQLINLVKQWAPLQQSLQPLLANVQQLLNASSPSDLARLPEPVRTALQQLQQTLPLAEQVRQPGHMRSAIENSGLLLEARMAKLVAPLTTGTAGAASRSPTTDSAQPGTTASTAVRAPTALLATLSQLVRDGLQRLAPATTGLAEDAKPSLAGALENALGQDLKLALQKLEVALRNAQPAGNPSSPATPSPPGGAMPTPAATPPAPSSSAQPSAATGPAPAGTAPSPAGEETPEQMLTKLAGQKDAASVANSTTQRPALHPGIQHYSASARAESRTTDTPHAVRPESLLLPPLPGQVLVQPQARGKPSLKGDEMADAIVNVLLKQVRGALARTSLHQIASSSGKQDSAAVTPTLSFEIPFLHGGHADLFQFRITEEKSEGQERRDQQLAKRWQVQLGFDIEGLGPMFCQLSLTGNNMGVTFWAAWEATLAQTRAYFDFLEQSLTRMGIHVEKMQGHLGMPENDRTGVLNQLVDIKT